MLKLYHFGFSTCSQKVRFALAEKRVNFISHEVDIMNGAQHDSDYVKLNPNHVVPTLLHDGRALIESTLINEYVDEAFPGPALRPADAGGRHSMRLWTKLLDEKVHAAAPVVTFAIGPRRFLLLQPEETREANIAAIPDPKAREQRRSVLAHGVAAPEFAAALHTMIDFVDRADECLRTCEWLAGDCFSLADAAAVPYVLRLEHLGMDPLLSSLARPDLARWYAAVKARPGYAEAIERWAPADIVGLLRESGAEVWPQVAALIGVGPRQGSESAIGSPIS